MANAIVSWAVKRLGDLLIQEAEFLYGVSEQVQNVQTELRRMQCFLKDADSKASSGDEGVRNWLAEIRDLAYDAEDVIETYALEVASRRRREGIMNVLKRFSCILNEGKALHKVGSEIEAITAKISNLTSSLQTYGIKGIENESSSSTSQRQQQLRRSYSHVAEGEVVGRDESIKELVKHLLDNEKNYRLVSICGMGGLGKTTLAKKVYRHGEVKRRFDYLAWSCISQQCKVRDVWEGILIKLNEPREEIEKLRYEEVAKKLYHVLQEKRCLVILDDIWSTQAWDSLRAAFPYEETSSKILLTTRNEEVALHADPIGFHYKPRCLDEKEGWELLEKIAIPRKDGAELRIDTRMEELGKEMVKHCGGLPLAITVLGGILVTKYSSKEWYMVHETIKSCLRRGKGHGQEQSGVLDVLALSYDDLPAELKLCFLYLSHFPEDYLIRVDKLIQLWIAEGFIKSERHSEKGEETLEDVAERYFNELVKRYMVLVEERDVSWIRICRMHDLIRDLCLSKAKEENFLHIVNCQNGDENVDSFLASSSGKIRRLAINVYGDISGGSLKCIKNRHLRSVLCFYESSHEPCSLELPVFKNLKMLRVLDLERTFVPWKFKDIGKLIHLRFLSLRRASLCELPASLGNLRCLQTLDLRISNYPVHIPNVLWKMEDLRHLYLPEKCDDKTKLRLGNLKNLQTLVKFSFRNFDVSEFLNNVGNLRVLSVRDLHLITDFRDTFKSRGITLKHLRTFFSDSRGRRKIDVGPLISGCINLYDLILYGQIEKLPDCVHLPASITYIEFVETQLEEDPMVTLEKLPNLRTLHLNGAFIGKQMVCSGEGFPQLYSLYLQSQVNLEEWRVNGEALPNLCHLVISWCKKLKTFPDGLRFVKSLQELKIYGMPKEFKDKLIEGGEDFYKVQHLPSVLFDYCDEE